MKKNGFTLSEALLAMAIIGVVAAVTTPILAGIMPDKRKVEVLKIYKVVTDINEELLADSSLYVSRIVGFANTDQPTDPDYANASFTGNCKYPRLLASKLNIKEDVAAACNSFTTLDGIRWSYVANPTTTSVGSIVIDIDGNRGKNCSYSGSCQKPDQFKFLVNSNGTISGNDPLTAAYLKNRMKLSDKKADYATAAKDTTKYSK